MPIPDEIKKYIVNKFKNKKFLKADRTMATRIYTDGVDRTLYRKTIDFFKENPHLVNDAINENTGKRLISYAAHSGVDNFLEDVIKISSINLNVKNPDTNHTAVYDNLSIAEGALHYTIRTTKLLIKHGAKIDNLNDRWQTKVGENNQETELAVIQRYSQSRNAYTRELANELLTLVTEKNFSTAEAYQEFRRLMDMPNQNTTMSEGAVSNDYDNNKSTNNR